MNNQGSKLDSGDILLLDLIQRDKDENGWTVVSKQVFPLVENLPTELVELKVLLV